MNKTIEEAARDHQFFGSYTERQAAYDGFIDGAKYVYKLPLASRLTADEKEMIRKEYAKTYPNDIDCGVENMLIQDVFGAHLRRGFFQGVNEEARTLRIALARGAVA